jgi:hypothetical protein
MKPVIEIWKDIEGFEGRYFVSNTGRVKSLYTGEERIMKLYFRPKMYTTVGLSWNGRTIAYQVHRLVATAFMPNLMNLREINHKDGNKYNNYIDNLEWCTSKENKQHAIKIGTFIKGESAGHAKLNEFQVRVIRKANDLFIHELATIFNMSVSATEQAKNRKTWKHV